MGPAGSSGSRVKPLPRSSTQASQSDGPTPQGVAGGGLGGSITGIVSHVDWGAVRQSRGGNAMLTEGSLWAGYKEGG